MQLAIAIYEDKIYYNKREPQSIFPYHSKEAELLDELLMYNKRREEIDEKVNQLTKRLIETDVSEFVDVQRLALQGQKKHYSLSGDRLENYLQQYGLTENDFECYGDRALFLTPFNSKGDRLFKECREILANVNILLQKSDNIIDKNDIMNNIVNLIVKSRFVVVNIDGMNPNVYYELGICHALCKQTILLLPAYDSISEEAAIREIGFDVRQVFTIMYNSGEDLEKKLINAIAKMK